jgi:uncharacterized protein YbbK (DUF523 family)
MTEDAPAEGTPVLVSACLLGLPTRYDGKAKRSETVLNYLKKHNLVAVPVCPEQLAGMTTPRAKTFFSSGTGHDVLTGNGQVISETGQDMNEVFCRGAKLTLQIARLSNSQLAILKERSPSCGVHQVYLHQDRVDGSGVTAALLKQEDIQVFSEEDF